MITGYVDSIDTKNDFIHIYDHESRHYVAVNSLVRPQVGQFVEFTPIIPKFGKFKKAVIHRIFLITAEGAESFGYRDVEVIATHPDKGYCSWRLVNPISPIFEIGVEEVSYTTGYMSFSIPILGVEKIGEKIQKGTRLRIIVFLKRYKGIKQPHVVRAEIGEKERLKRAITLLQENGKKDHMQKRKLDSMTLIIKAIFVDSNVTLEHLCHLTGRSQSTIELHLGYLINHNLITRQGPDKGGEWQLSDGE